MECGSIFGHGAYLEPDSTADYMYRAALSAIEFYAASNSNTARTRTIEDFKTNRHDSASFALRSQAQASAPATAPSFREAGNHACRN
jgi:nitric oxide reductase large subunit